MAIKEKERIKKKGFAAGTDQKDHMVIVICQENPEVQHLEQLLNLLKVKSFGLIGLHSPGRSLPQIHTKVNSNTLMIQKERKSLLIVNGRLPKILVDVQNTQQGIHAKNDLNVNG